MGPGSPGPCSGPRQSSFRVRRGPGRPGCPRGNSLSPTLSHGRRFGVTLGSANPGPRSLPFPSGPVAGGSSAGRFLPLSCLPASQLRNSSHHLRPGLPQIVTGNSIRGPAPWAAGAQVAGRPVIRGRHRPRLSERQGANRSPVFRGPPAGRPLAASPFTTRERPSERQFLRAEQAKVDAGMSEPSGWARSGKVGGRKESDRAVGLTAGTQCYEVTNYRPPPPWISFPLPLTPA